MPNYGECKTFRAIQPDDDSVILRLNRLYKL